MNEILHNLPGALMALCLACIGAYVLVRVHLAEMTVKQADIRRDLENVEIDFAAFKKEAVTREILDLRFKLLENAISYLVDSHKEIKNWISEKRDH